MRRTAAVGLTDKPNPKPKKSPYLVKESRAAHRTNDPTDSYYSQFEKLVAKRLESPRGVIFTTTANPDGLWKAYIRGLPTEHRQRYNCNTCQKFIRNYGGLVTISPGENRPVSLLWNELEGVPRLFKKSVAAMLRVVNAASVSGVFLSSERVLGRKNEGGWTHLSGPNQAYYAGSALKNADQAMAEKLEEFGMLQRGLDEYPKSVVETALQILRSHSLCRSEKALGIAEWLLPLYDNRSTANLWLAVAMAPTGYCHVKTTVISTLFDDIQGGYTFEMIQRRWTEKLHLGKYQRPQAPPKAGAIDRAEKIFESLGLAKALDRRFARLEDVPEKLWLPRPKPLEKNVYHGLFGHLLNQVSIKHLGSLTMPPMVITWEKFQREVLPLTHKLEIKLPNQGSFYGLTTAVEPGAPNLFQWDNPVAWYLYLGGSTPYQWQLPAPGNWHPVTAVFYPPHMWGGEGHRFRHIGRNVFFSLSGSKDVNNPGIGLFPEILRGELREVKAVMEAYSKGKKIKGSMLGNANGINFQDYGKPHVQGLIVRVNKSLVYTLDRWD